MPEVREHLQAFFAAANPGEIERVALFIAPGEELTSFGIGLAGHHWLLSADPVRVARFIAAQAKAGLRYRLLGGSVDEPQARSAHRPLAASRIRPHRR